MAMKTPRSVATPIEPNLTRVIAAGGAGLAVAGTAVGGLLAGTVAAGGGLAGVGLAGAPQAARRSRLPSTMRRPGLRIARIDTLPSRGRDAAVSLYGNASGAAPEALPCEHAYAARP